MFLFTFSVALMPRNAGFHRIVDNVLQGAEVLLKAGFSQCGYFPFFNQEPLVVVSLVQERGYEVIPWFFAITHCTDYWSVMVFIVCNLFLEKPVIFWRIVSTKDK